MHIKINFVNYLLPYYVIQYSKIEKASKACVELSLNYKHVVNFSNSKVSMF